MCKSFHRLSSLTVLTESVTERLVYSYWFHLSFDLNKGHTSASFITCGNKPSDRDLFTHMVMGLTTLSFICFKRTLFMLSCPLLFLFGNAFIRDLSSDSVMGVKNRL